MSKVTIELERKYKPSEIAGKKLITTPSEDWETNYKYVLNLIKRGELKAVNFSLGEKQSRYYVTGSEIARYRKEVLGLSD